MSHESIIFILGPSGAGKSTLGRWLVDDAGYFHLELDVWARDGIELAGLGTEWDCFWNSGDATPLCQALRKLMQDANRSAMVVTFSSEVCISRTHLHALCDNAITPLILFGTKQECLEAFFERETSTGRNLDSRHWHRHNASFDQFASEDLKEFRLLTFDNFRRIERKKLISEIQQRLGPMTLLQQRLGPMTLPSVPLRKGPLRKEATGFECL